MRILPITSRMTPNGAPRTALCTVAVHDGAAVCGNFDGMAGILCVMDVWHTDCS